ncbi:MAG: NAD kinase [Micrococcales bacterium]|nr:NAD kinase [Micrococcales bacterium]
MTRRALVVRHTGRPEALAASEVVLTELAAAGIEAVVAAHDTDPEDLPPFDLAVVLGGDGTILRATELTRHAGAPMLGVNLGRFGFLAEIEPDDVADATRRLAAGDYEVEERFTLDLLLTREDGQQIRGWALNEASLEKSEPSRMLDVGIEVDDHRLERFGCDGVIVATPTGSTAHAFSGGGPVVWPDVEGMIVVPLAAHALFTRPLVVGPSSMVTILVLEDSATAAVLTCDGHRTMEVGVGDRIDVWGSDRPVRLARLSPAPFTTRLVHKYELPVEGWRRVNGGAADQSSRTAGEAP